MRSSAVVMFVVVGLCACVPVAGQGQGSGEAAPPGPSRGGATCGDWCSHMSACGVLAGELDQCVVDCDAKVAQSDPAAVQQSLDSESAMDCGAIQQALGGGGGGDYGDYGDYGGGGGGGGGTGAACAASPKDRPVQDCPAGSQCCDSHCWTGNKCSWPTGN